MVYKKGYVMKNTVFNSIYNDLRDRIISGDLMSGNVLVEREIGERYGVSRTPVREVLWKLIIDGLIVQEPGKGYVIRRLTLNDIFEIFQTREGIEGMAARLACQRRNNKLISFITEVQKKLENIDIKKEIKKAVSLGNSIHGAIIEASGNFFIKKYFVELSNIKALTNSITKNYVELEKESLNYHLKIIEAIKSGDEEKSEQFMREHLRITCRLLVDYHYPDLYKKI